MRGARAEGQIKGAARGAAASQSARGLAVAPLGVPCVPRGHRNVRRRCRCRVPFALHSATLRQGLRHGIA